MYKVIVSYTGNKWSDAVLTRRHNFIREGCTMTPLLCQGTMRNPKLNIFTLAGPKKAVKYVLNFMDSDAELGTGRLKIEEIKENEDESSTKQ